MISPTLNQSRHRMRAFAVLCISLFLFAITQSSCGAHKQTIDTLPTLENATELPRDADALEQFRHRQPQNAEEALIQAYVHLLYIDLDEAFAALMSPAFEDAAPMLRLARIALMVTNYQDLIDPQPLRAWAHAQDPQEMFAQERVLFTELQRALTLQALEEDDADELPSPLPFGGARSWTVVGWNIGSWTRALQSQGRAEENATLNDLPLRKNQYRHTYNTQLAAITPNPYRGETALYESFVRVDENTEVAITRFGAQDYFSLWIDDTLVLQRDASDTNDTSYTMPRYELAPGTYRVRMMVHSGVASLELPNLIVLKGALKDFGVDVGPASGGTITPIRSAPRSLAEGLAPRTKQNELSWLVHAAVAALSDDTRGFDLASQDATSHHPIHALVRAHLFRQAQDAPHANSLALQALRAIDASWPDYPAIALRDAQISFETSENAEVLQRLTPWLDQEKTSPHLRVVYANMARRLGYDMLALRTLENVVKSYPQWCDAWTDYFRTLLRHKGVLQAEDFEQVPARCTDARWLKRVVLEQWRGNFEGYNAALERAWKRGGSSFSTGFDLFWQILKTEGPDAAEKHLNELLAAGAQEKDVLGEKSALAVHRGQEEEFYALLEGWAQRFPARADIQRARAQLLDQKLFADLRVDGMERVKAYRESQSIRTADIDEIYILRRQAWRWFKDGGGARIYHELTELHTNNAIAAVGEIGIPNDVQVLQLRVIKPDGSVRYPEAVNDRTALSMPDMEVGDVLEREYLTLFEPVPEDAFMYRTEPFYFQSTGAPIYRSELHIEYPESWGEAVDLEKHNFGGDHQTSAHDGNIIHKMTAQDMPTMTGESWSPPRAEYLPWAQWNAFYNQEKELDAWADAIVPALAPAQEINARAEKLLRGLKDEKAQLQALYRYVIDKVELTSYYFSTSARATERMKKGDRVALFYALAQAAGFTPEIVFVRSIYAPQLPIKHPWLSHFDSLAVRVKTKKDTHWLSFYSDHSPFGYLDAQDQNSKAMIVTGKERGTQITTPDRLREDGATKMDISVWLDENGDARIEMTWVGGATFDDEMRSMLRTYPSALERQHVFEELVDRIIGQAELTDLQIENEDAPEASLRIRLSANIDGLAEVQGQHLVIDRRFDDDLEWLTSTTTLPERKLPLRLYFERNSERRYTIHAPENYQRTRDLSDVHLTHLNHVVVREVHAMSGASIAWTQKLRLERGQIAPEAYKSFAAFGQQARASSRVRLEWKRTP